MNDLQQKLRELEQLVSDAMMSKSPDFGAKFKAILAECIALSTPPSVDVVEAGEWKRGAFLWNKHFRCYGILIDPEPTFAGNHPVAVPASEGYSQATGYWERGDCVVMGDCAAKQSAKPQADAVGEPEMHPDHIRYFKALKEIYHISEVGSDIEKHCIHALRITR